MLTVNRFFDMVWGNALEIGEKARTGSPQRYFA